MAISTIPVPSAGAGKTAFRTTLTSGSSYTVPSGVTYLNVTLVGGGGGAASINNGVAGTPNGAPGETISSFVTTTPGSSISYGIGAGGTGAASGNGGAGGTTTFTGATSAAGGNGGSANAAGLTGSVSLATNGGLCGSGASGTDRAGGSGGSGFIVIEYWA